MIQQCQIRATFTWKHFAIHLPKLKLLPLQIGNRLLEAGPLIQVQSNIKSKYFRTHVSQWNSNLNSSIIIILVCSNTNCSSENISTHYNFNIAESASSCWVLIQLTINNTYFIGLQCETKWRITHLSDLSSCNILI